MLVHALTYTACVSSLQSPEEEMGPMQLECLAVVRCQVGKECGYKSALALPFLDF